MIKVKKEAIAGLIKRVTFKVVLRNQNPKDANKIGRRSVLAIKDPGTNEER